MKSASKCPEIRVKTNPAYEKYLKQMRIIQTNKELREWFRGQWTQYMGGVKKKALLHTKYKYNLKV